MKLIALVTLVTTGGEIPPGGEIEVKETTEAQGLIDRGFAKEAEKPEPVATRAKAK